MQITLICIFESTAESYVTKHRQSGEKILVILCYIRVFNLNITIFFGQMSMSGVTKYIQS